MAYKGLIIGSILGGIIGFFIFGIIGLIFSGIISGFGGAFIGVGIQEMPKTFKNLSESKKRDWKIAGIVIGIMIIAFIVFAICVLNVKWFI